MEIWNPPSELSRAESQVLKLCKKQKLWGFLRKYRDLLLDESIIRALHGMYAESGRGLPKSPERLALAMVLQVGFQVADHEVPALTVVDQRWRMVLDLMESESEDPAFSQGTVFNFRQRAREHGFMTLLLERTVSLARETKGYSHKRLRMLIDSSPLVGAGRVEDSFNLIGRAMSRLVVTAAHEADIPFDDLADELELTTVSAKSVKAALDVDWRLPEARAEALNTLLRQFSRLRDWLEEQFSPEEVASPPLSDALDLIESLIDQDTEPDPTSPGSSVRRIREGGKDRRISISDADMRHGRKTKTKLFKGYKRHAGVDADVAALIVGVHLLPANHREFDGARPLLEAAEDQGLHVTELQHDRGYLAAEAIHERRRLGMRIVSKPPTPRRNGNRVVKADFKIDVSGGTVTCPGGRIAPVKTDLKTPAANFTRSGCTGCSFANRCLPAKASGSRRILIHPREELYQQMAAELATPSGRAKRRERTTAEHALARLGAIQGKRARYRGLAKNQFHTTACAVVANCFIINQLLEAA